MRAGIDVDHVNNLGWTALHESVILGDGTERYVDTVRVLVAAGADVGIPAVNDGLTAGEHAEQMGQTAVASSCSPMQDVGPGRRRAPRTTRRRRCCTARRTSRAATGTTAPPLLPR